MTRMQITWLIAKLPWLVFWGWLLWMSYVIGEMDGRIAECRLGWRTVSGAPAVWDRCRERLGRGLLQG